MKQSTRLGVLSALVVGTFALLPGCGDGNAEHTGAQSAAASESPDVLQVNSFYLAYVSDKFLGGSEVLALALAEPFPANGAIVLGVAAITLGQTLANYLVYSKTIPPMAEYDGLFKTAEDEINERGWQFKYWAKRFPSPEGRVGTAEEQREWAAITCEPGSANCQQKVTASTGQLAPTVPPLESLGPLGEIRTAYLGMMILLTAPFVVFKLAQDAGMADPKTGRCNADEHGRLQADVTQYCKPGDEIKMTCDPDDPCIDMATTIVRLNYCIAARTRINARCFGGLNDTHEPEVLNRSVSLGRCLSEFYRPTRTEACSPMLLPLTAASTPEPQAAGYDATQAARLAPLSWDTSDSCDDPDGRAGADHPLFDNIIHPGANGRDGYYVCLGKFENSVSSTTHARSQWSYLGPVKMNLPLVTH